MALNLNETDARLVTRQMPHSVSTSATYYQAIVGQQHAPDAYDSMTALRTGENSIRRQETVGSVEPCGITQSPWQKYSETQNKINSKLLLDVY